jgi:hypothetical protein
MHALYNSIIEELEGLLAADIRYAVAIYRMRQAAFGPLFKDYVR